MHFIDKSVRFVDFLFTFRKSKSKEIFLYMDNYIITLGTYLILMLFFKVYFAVAAKE